MFCIRVAKSAGFCFGVKRAVDMIERELLKSDRVYTFGEIIHNRHEIKRLKYKGLSVAYSVNDVEPGDTVVIRAHGISRTEERALLSKGVRLVDATCPLVKDVQNRVRELKGQGYQVVIFGDPFHPEVQALKEYSDDTAIVVIRSEDCDSIGEFEKVGLVSQTTKRIDDYKTVVARVFLHAKELRVFNTICPATLRRQEEARSIARWADLVFVIGGYNSSNTKSLFRLCADIQPNTHHLESDEEIDRRWFNGISRVGVTAGASTPQWIIERVVKFLVDIGGKIEDG